MSAVPLSGTCKPQGVRISMSKKGSKKKPATEMVRSLNITSERRNLLLLAGALLLALIVRLIALADLSATPYFTFILWDERVYHEWAQKIADGTFSSRSIYEFAPLFAYIMAFLYKIFSADLVYVRALNVILGVITCWFVYLIGTALVNRKVGLWACLVAALYKPLILYSIVPLKEALSTLGFAAVFYCFLVVIQTLVENRKIPSIRPGDLISRPAVAAVLLGLAAGLVINVRPNALVIVPFLFALPAVYALRDRVPFKPVAVTLAMLLLGITLAVAPFMVRNYVVAGKLALTTSQGGFNLYLGNNLSNPDPYYRPVAFATSSPFEQGIQFTVEASRRTGKTMTPEEASRYWMQETLREATRHPGTFLWKLWQKTLVLVNRFEACDHYDIDFLSEFAGTFRLPFFSFWLIFPLAMVGMIHGFSHDRKTRAVSLILAVYGLTLIAFFSNGRYRLPMVTLLIPLAVSGAFCILESIRSGSVRKTGLLCMIALIFLVIAMLPVKATDDKTAYYNTHALILNQKGLTREALHYWNHSSDMDKPFSAFANISLAAHYFQTGNPDRGYAYLNRIGNDSFALAQKYDLIGDVLYSQQNLSGAAEYYEKSLQINSSQRRTILKLIQLYNRTDPSRTAAYEERLRYVSTFYDLM